MADFGRSMEEFSGSLINFADNFASMFGVDIFKKLSGKKGGKFDWVKVNEAITQAFKNVELKTEKQITEFEDKLNALIGTQSSPATKSLLEKYRNQLKQQRFEAKRKAQDVQVEKSLAQSDAQAIDSMAAGDFMGREGLAKKDSVKRAIAKYSNYDEDTRKRMKTVEGWGDINEKTAKHNDQAKHSQFVPLEQIEQVISKED